MKTSRKISVMGPCFMALMVRLSGEFFFFFWFDSVFSLVSRGLEIHSKYKFVSFRKCAKNIKFNLIQCFEVRGLNFWDIFWSKYAHIFFKFRWVGKCGKIQEKYIKGKTLNYINPVHNNMKNFHSIYSEEENNFLIQNCNPYPININEIIE